MCFGMEVDDGWYNIIDSLSKCMKNHVDSRIEHEIIMREILTFWKIFVGWRKGWYRWNWYKHVWQNVKEYIRLRHPLDIDSMQIHAVQVKEKFGGLRFYVAGADNEVFGMIDMAEMMSYVTCEHCGNPGSLHQRGTWLKTLCRKCAKKLGSYKKCKNEE
jgi:hypothetical protein